MRWQYNVVLCSVYGSLFWTNYMVSSFLFWAQVFCTQVEEESEEMLKLEQDETTLKLQIEQIHTLEERLKSVQERVQFRRWLVEEKTALLKACEIIESEADQVEIIVLSEQICGK